MAMALIDSIFDHKRGRQSGCGRGWPNSVKRPASFLQQKFNMEHEESMTSSPFAPEQSQLAQSRWLHVSIPAQRLRLMYKDEIRQEFLISTGLNGPGETFGSGCTPRGWHRIRIKIGDGLPQNAVFVGRRFTGELHTPELAAAWPKRDWILGRILWLTGLESGFNRGGQRDTLRRYIYIHGTPDTEPMDEPRSHGCIRMRNADLVQLFEMVRAGDAVFIQEGQTSQDDQLTREALADVDAGRVIDHQAVRAWAQSL